jgi:hypothetical protein
MVKKVVKKKEVTSLNRNQFNLKIVTSDICEVCKSQCSRGIRYMEYMKIPGNVGRGVPCILTRGRK